MNTPSIAIELINVSKKYEIRHEKPTLVEKFIKRKNETFWALRNINLKIYKGEKVGIIGPNGSGKTTLLKIISRITTPSSGMVSTHGLVVSLIDLESGFHADLTGYQNIYLNAMLLQLSKKEIGERMQSIIAFADVRQFIDAPLFMYSTGMKLRLGFSIALHSNPDILVLDEGVNAGDRDFQMKLNNALHDFLTPKRAIIIVSHNLDDIKRYTNKTILMRRGRIEHIGTPQQIIRTYERHKHSHLRK